jgi:hypothetical protein
MPCEVMTTLILVVSVVAWPELTQHLFGYLVLRRSSLQLG